MVNRLVTWLWGHLPLSPKARSIIVWTGSPKFTVGVVGLVQDDEGRVLLLHHTYRGNKPWGLPGGGLRAGESLEECLRRELREEANLEIVIDGLLSAAAHYDRKLVDMIFACRAAPGASLATFKANAEVSRARFFKADELPPDMYSGQRRLIEIALAQTPHKRSFIFQPERGEWY